LLAKAAVIVSTFLAGFSIADLELNKVSEPFAFRPSVALKAAILLNRDRRAGTGSAGKKSIHRTAGQAAGKSAQFSCFLGVVDFGFVDFGFIVSSVIFNCDE
jgi:hypothetical protein